MLLGGLTMIAGHIAGRVLLSLGFYVLTVAGIDATLESLRASALLALNGLPQDVVRIMAYLKLGEIISVITGACTTVMLIKGLGPGGVLVAWLRR